MKKKNKSTRHQPKRNTAPYYRQEEQRRRRQATRLDEERLWREMQPRAARYDLDNADDEEWYRFAADTMLDSAELYDEPEFKSLAFDPADAIHILQNTFNAHVPAPEELERLSEEERDDILTEAHVRTATAFVQPELQRNILDSLARCRQRLKRESQTDKLALAASTEWILRSDSRPEIWGTCSILLNALEDSVNEAFVFEEAKAKALQRAQAVQSDVTNVHDLVEGSPADDAFWEVVDNTPGLEEYLDRQWELEQESLERQHQVNVELAAELFDPEEIDDFFQALVENLKRHGMDLEKIKDVRQLNRLATREFMLEQIPQAIKKALPPKRFRELMADLDDLIEDDDELDALVESAQVLRDQLSDALPSYWKSPFLAQLYLDSMLDLFLEEMGELSDEEDEHDDDQDELEDYEQDEDDKDDA